MKSLLHTLLSALCMLVSDAHANVKLSGCTGAVFIMPGMADDRNALVLTNGHCLGIGDYDWQGI